MVSRPFMVLMGSVLFTWMPFAWAKTTLFFLPKEVKEVFASYGKRWLRVFVPVDSPSIQAVQFILELASTAVNTFTRPESWLWRNKSVSKLDAVRLRSLYWQCYRKSDFQTFSLAGTYHILKQTQWVTVHAGLRIGHVWNKLRPYRKSISINRYLIAKASVSSKKEKKNDAVAWEARVWMRFLQCCVVTDCIYSCSGPAQLWDC